MITGFRQIAVLTAFSRVLGMLRDMAFAYFLGASGLMDGWVIAFMLPNLARRLFGEGAAAASLIPVYCEEAQKDREKAAALAWTVFTAVLALLVLIVLAGEAVIWTYWRFFSVHEGTRLKLSLAAVMLPYMIMVCLVAILVGILHAHRRFASGAAAPVVLNVFIITALCASGWLLDVEPKRQVFIVAAAVLAAGLAQLAMQIPSLRASGLRIRPAWAVRSEAFRKVAVLMAPMIVGLTATQINTMADHFTALWLSGSAEKGGFLTLAGIAIRYPMWEGSVSQLFYSQRLYQYPLGVMGISLATVIFPVMSADAARKDLDAFCRTVSRGLRLAVSIAMPATAGLLLVRRPLISVIFERGRFTEADTALTAGILGLYCLGLCGFFMQQIAARAFFSMQDSRTPTASAVAAVGVNIALNLTLVWFLAARGLALATSACSYLQVAILLAAMNRRFGRPILAGLSATAVKAVLASILFWLAGAAVLDLLSGMPVGFSSDIIRLAAVVPVCAAIYLAAARLLGMEVFTLLTGRGQAETA
jgi:putative peptidoglycan lipid II flippase